MTSTERLLSELRAALTFDRPALSRSASEGAQAFIQIFDLRWTHDDDAAPDGPLGLAATGLKAAFSDDRQKGRRLFVELAGAGGDEQEAVLARMLGRGLLAWSADPTEEELSAAAAEAALCDDDHVAALYLLKLAGFALDAGERERASSLLQESLERAPEERERLRWRLRQVAAALRGEMESVAPPPDVDPLSEFPWIWEQSSRAARDAVRKEAESAVASPWRRSIHFGSTPVDDAMAAVLQAEWAGALWLLPALRHQHAAMTLIAGGRDADEWEQALANWVLGRGSRIRDVAEFVEPHFAPESTRRVLEEHLLAGRRVPQDRYIELLLALWDLLDDQEARDVLINFSPPLLPREGEHDELLALWTVLGVVVPETWSERFGALPPESQSALLPHLTPPVVRRLSDSSLHVLSKRAVEATQRSLDTPESRLNAYRAAIVLVGAPNLPDDDRSLLLDHIERAPREFLLELAPAAREYLQAIETDSLLIEALQLARRERSAGRQGLYTMYARSPVRVAAEAAVAFSEAALASEIVESILETALDESVVPELRIDALNAGFRIALSHRFDELVISWAGRPTDFLPDPLRPRSDPAFQRVLLDCMLFVSQRSVVNLPLMLAASRDSDGRIRHLALRSVGDALEQGLGTTQEGPLLWSAVVGGLFDPTPQVVGVSLDVLAAAKQIPRELLGVVGQRLHSLFGESGRSIRAAVVRTSVGLTTASVAGALLEDILSRASTDRSWLVRDAARAANAPDT